jgi:tripartite-type tricarboxylate transporter receptor subunit TctC
MKRALCFASLLFFAFTFSVASYADDAVEPAEFYKGKKIDFTLNERPGGDMELFGRLVGPYIKDYTGATPIFTNLRGAGGSDGYVHIFKAKPDGLTMGIGALLPMILNRVTEAPGAQYEPDKFGYLCSFLRVRNVFVVAKEGPYKTVADLKAAKKLIFGATSPQGNLALSTMSCIELLNLDAKVITGTKGIGPLAQTVVSGEVAGTCVPMQVALKGIKDGHYRPLFTLASERFDLLPDVPSIAEIANIKGNEDKEELLKIWDENLVLAHAIMVSPGVSEEKLAFLRGILPKLKNSPQFTKDIEKLWAFPVPDKDILTGEQVERLVKNSMSKAGKMKAVFLELLKKYKI